MRKGEDASLHPRLFLAAVVRDRTSMPLPAGRCLNDLEQDFQTDRTTMEEEFVVGKESVALGWVDIGDWLINRESDAVDVPELVACS